MNSQCVLLWLCVAAVGCRTEGSAEVADAGGAARAAEAAGAAPEARAEPAPADADGEDPQPDSTLAAVGSPSEQAEAAVAEPEPEPTPEPAPDPGPHTVLILGDSLAATGFGALLEKKLDATDGIVCHRKGKSASGLARPDFFDWIAEGKKQIDARDPDLVVVILGGNDGQDLCRTKRREGNYVRWKKEGWEEEYRRRMDEVLAEISGPERKVLWLGLPTMGITSFERKLELIRRIQQEAVEATEGATYLDTIPYVSDEDGKMLTEAQVGNRRKPQVIRSEDRIHFTMSGSEYFADKIYPEVLTILQN
jgi:hypothetical protein